MYSKTRQYKIIAITILANILTWYEFSLFFQMFPYMGSLFSPKDSTHLASLLQFFSVYAIGFVSRPLGVLFFAHVGDKIGRKTALVISISLMTIPTLFIGCIPSFATIGFTATIMLAFFRLLQGFCLGGELAGTMCYLYEISPVATRTFFGSLTFFGSQLGHILSAFEFLALERFSSPEEMMRRGWRISFIVGGVIGLIGWYLRRHLTETPLFEVEKTEGKLPKKPIFESLQAQKMQMAKGFFLSALTLGGWYMLFVFSQSYFAEILQLSSDRLQYTNIAMLIFSTALLPIFGFIAGHKHKRALFFISIIGILIFSFPLYLAAIHFYYLTFMILQLIVLAFLSIQFALLPTLLCEIFPLRIRYSCVGLSYNFSNLIFGTAIPFASLALTIGKEHLLAPAFLLVITAILSLWAFTRLKEERAHPI